TTEPEEVKKSTKKVETEKVVEMPQVEESNTAKAGKRSAKALAEKDAETEKAKRKSVASEKSKTKNPTKKLPRARSERKGKKYREIFKQIDNDKSYSLAESIDLV